MEFSPFIYQTVVHLYETDSAKVIFFGRLSEICHRAVENFFSKKGVFLSDVILNNEVPYLFYVRHFECDFIGKISFLDEIEIQMRCSKIGNSSFSLSFDIYRQEKKSNDSYNSLANAKIVYVCVDKKSGQKINVPIELQKILNPIFKK